MARTAASARGAISARSAASARSAIVMPYSLVFDGSDDRVDMGDKRSLEFDVTNEFTLECWFKPLAANNNKGLISKSTGSGTAEYMLAFQPDTSNKLKIYLYTDGTNGNRNATTTALSDTNKWYHLAVTWNSIATQIYVDGVAETMNGTEAVGTILTTSATFKIGTYLWGGSTYNTVNGRMVEVRVWNKALDINDLLDHYNNPSSISSVNTAGVFYATNCMTHYRMLEQSGTTINDLTGRGNAGVFKAVGEPAWNSDISTGLTSRLKIS